MASTIKCDTIQSTTANVFFQNSSGTEYARFDSGGNLGIGTTTPGAKLDVRGSSTFLINAANPTAWVSSDSSLTTQSIYMQVNTTSSDTRLGSYTNHPLLFLTNNTERMRINSGAPILCLAGGNTSATGTGIAFPATQSASSDANTLDDYEEGTWTPSVTGTVSGGPFTFGTSQAYYTKIGREVKLSMFMAHNSTVTFSGAYKIGNFPFTVANYSGGGFVSYIANWISNSPVMLQVEASTTYGYLRMKTSANPEQMFDLNSGLIQNNTAYMLTILYMTTT